LRCARRMVSRLRDRYADEADPMVIVNRMARQSLFGGSGLRRADVERVLGERLAGTVTNNYALVHEAIDRGIPLEDVKPNNNVSADLRRIIFA